MKYRIENVRIVRYGRKDRKAFKAFELKGDAYVYVGDFLAPKNTPKSRLHEYIGEER